MEIDNMAGIKDPAVAFFHEHAGYSYGRGESKSEGKMRGAKKLAQAEAAAKALGYDFKWDIDEDSSSADFTERGGESYALWVCDMLDPDGEYVRSLSGIDFGSGEEPWGNPYKRVVEAELALEQLG